LSLSKIRLWRNHFYGVPIRHPSLFSLHHSKFLVLHRTPCGGYSLFLTKPKQSHSLLFRPHNLPTVISSGAQRSREIWPMIGINLFASAHPRFKLFHFSLFLHHSKFLVLPQGMAKPDIRYSLRSFTHPSFSLFYLIFFYAISTPNSYSLLLISDFYLLNSKLN
jgi:hypothetical protein